MHSDFVLTGHKVRESGSVDVSKEERKFTHVIYFATTIALRAPYPE